MSENSALDNDPSLTQSKLVATYLRGVGVLPQTHWGTSLTLGRALTDANPPFTFKEFVDYELNPKEIETIGQAINVMHERYGIKPRYPSTDIDGDTLHGLWVTAKKVTIKRLLRFAKIVPGLQKEIEPKGLLQSIRNIVKDEDTAVKDFVRLGEVLSKKQEYAKTLQNIFTEIASYLSSETSKHISNQYKGKVSQSYKNFDHTNDSFRQYRSTIFTSGFNYSELNLVKHLKQKFPDLKWDKYNFPPTEK